MKRSIELAAIGLLAFCAAGCVAKPLDTVPPARPRYTAADVRFISGMIPHHGQAVLIAGWAQTHGAGERVRALCEKIVVAQRDEIATMQTWLRDHGEEVPGFNATPSMGGMDDPVLMPGMLSSEQLSELDHARGAAFDRLFLMSMIQHHQGAITMVDELMASRGGAQDETIYRLASEVYADQKVEIERMERMLAATTGEPPA